MEELTIHAKIPDEKSLEFNQSKLSFINRLKRQDGYEGYHARHGTDYKLIIAWADRQKLDEFMSSDLYHFLQGAIHTLGTLIEVNVKSKK